MARRRVVFLGTGHAHLHALRRLGRLVEAGHEAVVIAPGPFWYSGLATAVLGGRRAPEDDVIDVASLVRRSGGVFVQAEVSRICPGERMVHIMDGPPIAYDVLSLALGSVVAELEGGPVFAAKPVSSLWDVRRAIERHAGGPLHAVVAGAGMTGCEVAANVAALGRRLSRPVTVTLLADGPALAPSLPAGARRVLGRALQEAGVTVRTGSGVASVRDGVAVLADGGRLGFGLLVNATGLRPHPLVRASGLPVDAAGALVVDAALRCPSDPAVHGGGDCIAFLGTALPRAGVFGVRQAPVLFNNLLAALGLARVRRYRPQRRHLWVMNLGDGSGLACWGGLHWRSPSALRLKDWLDDRFLARYQPCHGETS